ncbi:MAG: hypothetical protein ACPGWR_00635 [Ardenticatenaceae bacterium]
MSNLSAFEQHWKLPTGFFTNDTLPSEWRVCEIVQHPSTTHKLQRLLLEGNSFFCPVGWSSTPDALQPLVELRNPKSGESVAVIGQTKDGKLYVPFDIQEAIDSFQLERYIQSSSNVALFGLARRLYYLLRPLIPRPIQIKFRQLISPLQDKRDFPEWPIDMSLDKFHRLLLRLILQVSQISRVPFIWFWPDGYANAVVLTHDVETQVGHDNIWPIVKLEKKYGFRSLWNFVPKRYDVDSKVLATLKAEGFEIGVHGLYHDGHLFGSRGEFEKRVTQINHYLQAWKSESFRSPAALRNLTWISESVEATYDTSCPMTEIHVPQPGGCCSVFPFMVGSMVELPFTMPQDHTLFTILKQRDERVWFDVASEIMANYGLVNVIVHPDYMLDPTDLSRYESLLQWLSEQNKSWFALPREVAAWWRTRNQQELKYTVDDWQIKGPEAGRATITYASATNQDLVLKFGSF